MINKSEQIFQRPRNHLKILGGKKSDKKQVPYSGATLQHLVAKPTWHLGFVNTWWMKKKTLNPTTIGHMTQAISLSTLQQCSPHYKTKY